MINMLSMDRRTCTLLMQGMEERLHIWQIATEYETGYYRLAVIARLK